jgi:hypothetical protein
VVSGTVLLFVLICRAQSPDFDFGAVSSSELARMNAGTYGLRATAAVYRRPAAV